MVLAALLVSAPVLAQSPSPPSHFDGQYVGRRLSLDSQFGCTSREGKVTFNVSAGRVSTANSGETSAPVDESGNFTLKYDLTISGVGPATATFKGQIANDVAKGTVQYSATGLPGCNYSFSAPKQVEKK